MYSSDFTIDTVRVSSVSAYHAGHSQPVDGNYVFAYRIRITNMGKLPARLLRRHWFIIDGAGQVKEVEGEGVVGQKPTILPGDTYEYTSWVQFTTPTGAMEGNFLMEQPAASPDEKAIFFRAEIPRFLCTAPELLN